MQNRDQEAKAMSPQQQPKQSNGWNIATFVTLGLALAGGIYKAGKFEQKLDSIDGKVAKMEQSAVTRGEVHTVVREELRNVADEARSYNGLMERQTPAFGPRRMFDK